MWECIAKKLALPWYQVESRFWQIFRERPNLVGKNKSSLLLEPNQQKVGRVALTSAPRSDLRTPLMESDQRQSRKRPVPNPRHDGMRKRRRPIQTSWNEIDDVELSEFDYQTVNEFDDTE